jgi:hypothetical protein
MIKLIRTCRGLSLLEVIIAMSVMMIGSLALVSMSESSTKQIKQLSEKLAVLDVEKFLITTLADGSVCTLALTQPVSATFDARKLRDANPPVISVNKIFTSASSNAPILLQVGQPINENDKNIIVRSIKFMGIKDVGSGNAFNANLFVELSTNDTNRPLKPIVLGQQFSTDPQSPMTAKKVISCSSNAPDGQIDGLKYYPIPGEYDFVVPTGVTKVRVEAHGGGGGGSGIYGFSCRRDLQWYRGTDGEDSLFNGIVVGGGGKAGGTQGAQTQQTRDWGRGSTAATPGGRGGASGPNVNNYEGYSVSGMSGTPAQQIKVVQEVGHIMVATAAVSILAPEATVRL